MFKVELSQSKYKDLSFNDEYLNHIIDSMIERVSFVKEFVTNSPYFFERPTTFDETVIKKKMER